MIRVIAELHQMATIKMSTKRLSNECKPFVGCASHRFILAIKEF